MSSSTAWRGASAIVTGAASGIGLALAKALLRRGAEVWMADANAVQIEAAAAALGPKAHAATLDVRDAAALRALVDAVVAAAGRLDFMFNNAGIGIAGETQALSPAHFERIVGVNIMGVVNGCLAAYAQMLTQGHGHIVNTASLAGLTPVPLLTPYAMSKHAVVGLTVSLREEGALHGVRVSAICPAAIDTPLLDAAEPADLPSAGWQPDVRGYLTALSGPPYSAERCAEDALRGVERNQALIIMPARARVIAWLYRMAPGLARGEIARGLSAELKKKGTQVTAPPRPSPR